ncbi:MAG: inositol monophosphatase family protein [Actinomycetaceae bacterium]|nr:inositol monophosphatase family protein [Actinomycetaceae bacterium]
MNTFHPADDLREEIWQVTKEVALQGAQRATQLQAQGVSQLTTKSSPVDPVTQADLEVEELLRSRLAQLRPDDGITGEELPLTPGKSGYFWVIDPIDGTVNYLYGGASAVSVACVYGSVDPGTWTPVACAIAEIGSDNLYHGALGAGAYLGEDKLSVRPGGDLQKALVGTGFGYTAQLREQQGHVLAQVIGKVRDIRRTGAAALEFAAVAAGRQDLYFEGNLTPFDLAAGTLLVTEAGGVARNLQDGPADENMAIAGGAGYVTALRELLLQIDSDAASEQSEDDFES